MESSREDPPQYTMRWIPPERTYGALTNYTLHWGVKNGALRKEIIEPNRLRWVSDYLGNEKCPFRTLWFCHGSSEENQALTPKGAMLQTKLFMHGYM